MRYNYVCNDCVAESEKRLGRSLSDDENMEHMFETAHSMFPTPKELKATTQCPVCDGHNTQKTYAGNEVHVYVAGNGYLDVKGCKRDMNVYKLTKEDPYAHMRQPGEAEDMAHQLRAAGKRGYNTAKHYDMSKPMEAKKKPGRKKA